VLKRYNINPIAVDMKTITCREAGFDCDYVVKGETDEEVMKSGAEHAMKDHGYKPEDITPEFKEKVRGLIRTT
jgi:predicted small metal-binding protein